MMSIEPTATIHRTVEDPPSGRYRVCFDAVLNS
jgi:hypothetical protein